MCIYILSIMGPLHFHFKYKIRKSNQQFFFRKVEKYFFSCNFLRKLFFFVEKQKNSHVSKEQRKILSLPTLQPFSQFILG